MTVRLLDVHDRGLYTLQTRPRGTLLVSCAWYNYIMANNRCTASSLPVSAPPPPLSSVDL